MAAFLTAALVVGTCSRPPPILEQVLGTGVLKVATRNSPTAYYLGVEGPEGPEYELASEFARQLGVEVEFIISPSAAAAVDEVVHNRAQLAAAGIVVSGELARRVAFGPVYQTLNQHVIYRARERAPAAPVDLAGKRIAVVAGSEHADALAALMPDVAGLGYREVAGVDQLDLLARVSSGEIDYTVADSTEFSIGRHFHPDLALGLRLAEAEEVAWALRRSDESLASRVRNYFAALERSDTLPSLLKRYYEAAERFDYVQSVSFIRRVQELLPTLRPFFEEAAAETGFDWRLLAAIAYQESKFDAGAISPTGVRGIMMLTEDTARRVGIEDRLDARSSILGGARYLIEVRGKIPDRIAEPDRTWLALAGYNVGFGHLEDARILTQRQGGSPDSWQDVRRHLPLLAQERWYLQARFGYARGWEPVRFVDNIISYRDLLVWMTGAPENELRLGEPAAAAVGPVGSQ